MLEGTQVLAAASGGGGSGLVGFLPLLLIAAVFYFLVVRPQASRARAAREVQANLSVDAEVVTTSGVIGRIVELDDEVATLQVAPGSTIRFVRAAIGEMRTPAPDGDADSADAVLAADGTQIPGDDVAQSDAAGEPGDRTVGGP